MHRLHAAVVGPLIEALEPRAIVEIGAGSGQLTRKLLAAPGADGATVHAVDPEPRLDPDLLASAAERLVVHSQRGVGALMEIGAVDLAILDGDPNWYTVHTELSMLMRAAGRAERPAPLVIVHNVHWPFGRRDGYHDPAAIPEAHRHEHSDLGLVPGRREPSEGGLRLAPYCAAIDFQPRSGVLTGIEDALAGSGHDFDQVEIPGFNGCAVLAESRLLEERPALAKLVDGLRGGRFLAEQARRAESARIALEVELAGAEPEPESIKEPEHEPKVAPAPEEVEPKVEEPEADGGLVAALEAARAELAAELAEQRARREALEWRLERVDADLAERDTRLEALKVRHEEEQKGRVAAEVRLEEARRGLTAEREAVVSLRVRIEELESIVEERERELAELTEKERLTSGRLSHREDALQAAGAEAERLRDDLDRARKEAEAARDLLSEVAGQLELAELTRGVRLGRAMRRLGRALTFRAGHGDPRPLELARAAATRNAQPPPSVEPGDSDIVPLPEDSLKQ